MPRRRSFSMHGAFCGQPRLLGLAVRLDDHQHFAFPGNFLCAVKVARLVTASDPFRESQFSKH